MTPEEINRAIAEHCGWKQGRHFEQILTTGEGEWWDTWIHPTTEEELYFQPYDYYNDLNAMSEAEKIFDTEGAEAYEDMLADVCCVDKEQNCKTTSFLFHATAAQRAEAFLRTIGKWRDTTKEEVA